MNKTLWLYNKSTKDIILNDLNLSIKRKRYIDVFKHNPNLTYEQVRYSFLLGSIRKCINDNKLIEVSGPPKKQHIFRYKEFDGVISSRAKTCIEIDSTEKYFIDELAEEFIDDPVNFDEHESSKINEKFVESINLEGFTDPLDNE